MENFEELLKKAENGDAEAQCKVGDYYIDGKVVEKDYKKAFEWFNKAAEQGNSFAQNQLGICFFNGIGVEKNYDKAFEWCEKAANLGNANAQCALGTIFYVSGQGVEKDEKKAFEWISKAAEQGLAEAQNYLGICYSKGIGVTRNKKEAEKWYKKAAEQGYDTAKINLGYRYVFGKDENVETKKKRIRKLELIILPILDIFKKWYPYIILLICYIVLIGDKIYHKYTINNINFPLFKIILTIVLSAFYAILLAGLHKMAKTSFETKDKERDNLLKEISELEEEEQKKKAAAGDKEAQERILATQKKKDIDEIVSELNAGHISEEHSRAKLWYRICLGLMLTLLGIFGYVMYCNYISASKLLPPLWQEMVVRVLISMSLLSLIFILMNQAARSRKTMTLLSREIQEFKYIGALLKGKVGLSTDSEKTNSEIDKVLNEMINQHLEMQKLRLEKEDHSEVKDITPEVLTFFKDNTSSIMGNFNEMQKNILELQKTIVQTINNQKKE